MEFPAFERRGVAVAGISADPVERQRRFRDRLRLPYPLLCDPGGDTLRGYGAAKGRGTGGRAGSVRRITYLIGPDGRIERAAPNVFPLGHARRILADWFPPASA